MRATNRDGIVSVVILNASCGDGKCKDIYTALNGGFFSYFANLNENLMHLYSDILDIIKVQVPSYYSEMLSPNAELKTLWERDERREMTLKEIEEALGYSIKIKEDKP